MNVMTFYNFFVHSTNGKQPHRRSNHMSLGIAFKGPEGIVLAADSRVTLNAELTNKETGEKMLLPASFDNATKLLIIDGHKYVGVVTYGLGALGEKAPRTAHSFMPEFEGWLKKKTTSARLTVKTFATRLSEFFMEQWDEFMPKEFEGPNMVFMVGGYDTRSPYGKIIRFDIPANPQPDEQNPGLFGISWGGQLEYTTRLIKGYDPGLPAIVKEKLNLSDKETDDLKEHLKNTLGLRIPYQFLPLQDCVDLSIFLIRTTIELQAKMVGVRGVGGDIDVATITRTEGIQPIQQKKIKGS